MQILERVWENTGLVFSNLLQGVERGVTSLFGSSNARQVKRFEAIVAQINQLEPTLEKLTDEELRGKTAEFQQRIRDGQTFDDILVEAFAVCREGGKRFLNMRHYDVQLIGGIVLHNGMIAEMVTGEGKTLVATLPAYLNALAGRGCHVVTVNDYLARRDMEWMAPLYMGLGLSVGAIQGGISNDERQAAYAKDITYATNNELGFDYLRDNMRLAARNDDRFDKPLQQVQGPLAYAIIDEVDNILIDEARTPLIISGPAHQDVSKYKDADRVARGLKKDEHFTVNEKDHTVNLTDEGVRAAEKLAGVESFYTAGNMEWPHMIDNALKAHYLYKKDVSYVVKDGQIIIVDDFTGRLMEGRQWSDGLHQAVESKEGVRIKEETQTLATITLQNFFKLYDKISGMTGTAMTEANEFWKIYKLDVIAIPTNRGLQRIEFADTIFLTENEKFVAVAEDVERTTKLDVVSTKDDEEYLGEITKEDDEQLTIKLKGTRETKQISKSDIEEINRRGRPVLIGTVSIEKSEQLGQLLEKRGIPHQVLNAKHHQREAEIVSQAGRVGAVTIATNMAGRGTDIILGGNPETMAWAQLQSKYPTRLDVPQQEWETLVGEIDQREQMSEAGKMVRDIGGLYVIGTERHESRRIDLQLRGRCGRQGDPGSSRFYLSLEDDLMRIFAGDWVRGMMSKLGMGEGEAIENAFVSRRITAAQKKVEERNFEIRKNLLEYDEVMDQQRKRVYSYRQQILDGVSCREMVLEQIHQQIEHYVSMYTDPMFGAEAYTKFVSKKLSCELEARDFRNLDPGTAAAYAIDAGERSAETQIVDKVEENLPADEDQEDWNWNALSKWLNTRYGTNYSVNDLKRIPREEIDEKLIERVFKQIGETDLSEGDALLHADYGLQMLAGWMKNKFGIEVAIEDLRSREAPDIQHELITAAEEGYQQKECEFPVIAALTRFGRVSQDRFELDQEGLLAWARSRFDRDISEDELQVKTLADVRTKLIEISRAHYQRGLEAHEKGVQHVNEFFGSAEADTAAKYIAGNNGALDSLSEWFDNSLSHKVSPENVGELDQSNMLRQVRQAVDDRYNREIRRMERQVLLNIVDGSWKDHLLAMDHLRSAISLKSYAQMDPKVEYKREGMRMYGDMWFSIGEKMTDLIFRMEALDEGFIASTWQETSAEHEAPPAVSEQQLEDLKAADQAGAPERKPEPIRNIDQKVGRNDPCPCGSGKKYKACCGRR
ncbi:MAG TPA: preprotein translocase subunit SecA [Planctomycetaceae bacterium]|nr:preprotein translocase subunit SecA [Planctomycetaceae bacterium]